MWEHFFLSKAKTNGEKTRPKRLHLAHPYFYTAAVKMKLRLLCVSGREFLVVVAICLTAQQVWLFRAAIEKKKKKKTLRSMKVCREIQPTQIPNTESSTRTSRRSLLPAGIIESLSMFYSADCCIIMIYKEKNEYDIEKTKKKGFVIQIKCVFQCINTSDFFSAAFFISKSVWWIWCLCCSCSLCV